MNILRQSVMHDIYWAISQLLDGHRIRRASWVPKDVVLSINENAEIIMITGRETEPFTLSKFELEADNWELSDTFLVEHLGDGDYVFVGRAGTDYLSQVYPPVVK